MEPQNSDVEMQRDRRVLYFSDGVLNMTDSENEDDGERNGDVADAGGHDKESRLKSMATKVLAGIDVVGGGLASLLGITAPKYRESYMRSTTNSDADLTDNGNNTWLRSYERRNKDNAQQQQSAIIIEPK